MNKAAKIKFLPVLAKITRRYIDIISKSLTDNTEEEPITSQTKQPTIRL